MADVTLPPCGLYRTIHQIADVPKGRLVYFHNHGDPGPGVYLPSHWKNNRAMFHDRGYTLTDPGDAASLEPLEPEGFYRVLQAFHCCDARCRAFEPEMLVQLGYDAEATPILFVPELIEGALGLPDRGTRVDRDRLVSIRRLRVPVSPAQHGQIVQH